MPTKEKKTSSKSKTSPSKKDRSSSSKDGKKKTSSGRTSSKRSGGGGGGGSSSSRKSKSPSRSRRREAAETEKPPATKTPAPAVPPPPLPPPPAAPTQDPKASSDFEAGLLFQRFARNGGVNAKAFQQMWRDVENNTASATEADSGGGVGEVGRGGGGEGQEERRRRSSSLGEIGRDKIFEFGQLFQQYDTDGDGKLGRADFECMMGGMLSKTGGRAAAAAGSGEGAPVATTGTAVPTGPTPAQTAASIPAPPAPVADGPSISHYDETTGVPLTREAVASQLSLGHTVVPLSEAYNRRLSRLQTLTSSRLMPVREQLLQLRRRFHSRADEVKAAKSTVERETLADAGAIVERLRSVEALKQAMLTQGVNDVTAELEVVEKIADQIAGVSTPFPTNGFASPSPSYSNDFEGAEKMVELVQSYPELCSSIDRVSNKPFDPAIDVRADDFPHETAERLEVLRRADRYEQALNVKDQMLWTVTQESQAFEEQCEEERRLGHEFAEEAQEWVALAGKFSDNVNTLKKEAVQLVRLREENALLARENQELAQRLEALEGKRLTGGG